MNKLLILMLLPLFSWATKPLQDVRVVAVKDTAGKITGYECVEVMPGSIYDELGLKVGDVILKVDDVPALEPQTMMKLHQNLKKDQRVLLQVSRRGKLTTLRGPAKAN